MTYSKAEEMEVILFSFGYKHGMAEADLVLDVRFLPNPYWVEDLRDGSGLDEPVADHALNHEAGDEFFALTEPLLLFLCRQFSADKRQILRIGIGCTGGRHRSVAVAERLAKKLLEKNKWLIKVFHRDIDKV